MMEMPEASLSHRGTGSSVTAFNCLHLHHPDSLRSNASISTILTHSSQIASIAGILICWFEAVP